MNLLLSRSFENRIGIRGGFISSLSTIASTTRFGSRFNELPLVASSSDLIMGKHPDMILNPNAKQATQGDGVLNR